MGNLCGVTVHQHGVFEWLQNLGQTVECGDALPRHREVIRCQAALEDKVHERASLSQTSSHLIDTMIGQILSRILIVGKHHAHQLEPRLVEELHGALGSSLTSGVSVKEADDASLGKAGDGAHVIDGKRGAKGCDRVGQARLVHRDHIGIALAHDGLTRGSHALLGTVEGKEML